MPKIRSLKAEFFQDEDVSTSLTVKVLAAGLVCCMADDEGRFKALPATIKALVFTHDRVTTAQIGEGLAILERLGFIQLYQSHGKPAGQITNWQREQYIPPKRRADSKIEPPPPRTVATVPMHDTRSADAVQMHDEDMAAALQVHDSHSPRARAERKGKEGIGRDSAGEPAVRGEDPDYIEIGRAWEVMAGHTLSATDREEVRTQLVQLDRLPVSEIIGHLGDFMEWWSTQGIDRRPTFKNAISWLKDKNVKAADSGRRLALRGVAS